MSGYKLFVICFALLPYLLMGQDPKIQVEIDRAKKEAIANGFTLIEEGGGYTNSDYVWMFDQNIFRKNNQYFVLAFFEKCYSCPVTLRFWNTTTGNKQNLEPEIKSNQGYVRATYKTDQSFDVEGQIYIYVNATDSYYTYALLFYRYIY